MSYVLMGWAVKQRTGSPTEKAVLIALADRANPDTGICRPSIERIALDTEFGETAVKRALKSLVDKGFVTRQRLRREDGSWGTYEYEFHVEEKARDDQPEAAEDPGTTGARGPAEPGLDLEQVNLKPSPPKVPPKNAIGLVDRKPVKADHERLARQVLDEWNVQTDQGLTSTDWLRMIVMRIREHPELTDADHGHLIALALADPWWTGPPSPNVIYGNGAQFERTLTAARAGPAKPRAKPTAMRYGRGMTTEQILAMRGGGK